MKNNLKSKFFAAFMTLFSAVGFSQLSSTGQVLINAPSVLSACSSDTIFFDISNLEGPSCPSGSANVSLEVTLPDTLSMTYQAASVGSMPAGAAEVSYVAGVLKFNVPSPGFGSTTKAWIVLNSKCEVVTLTPLPQLNVTINYPAGFTTPTESLLSTKMNVGVGTIYAYLGSVNYASTVAGFGQFINYQTTVTNTGFGRISEVTYQAIISDSLYPHYAGDWVHISGANVPAGSVAGNMNTFPDYSISYIPGYRIVSFTIKGADLDAVDGYLDPGDLIIVRESYFDMPTTCQNEMSVRSWFSYKCVGGGAVCQVPDTLFKTFDVSAGTPIIAGTSYSIDAWDGLPNKSAIFSFENTGVPDANRPEVSTAYDVDLTISFGGIINVSSVMIGGSAVFPTVQTIPGNVNQINLLIKDLLTTDIDGPGGLEDLDGDGYFDDMAPGATLPVSFTWEVPSDAASGVNLNYDFKTVSKYTDFCRKLDGSTNTSMYKFGFSTPIANTVKTPIPNLGTLAAQQIATAQNEYKFRFKKTNVDLTSADVKLVLNYNKTDEVIDTVRFLGKNLLLENDFTLMGTGFTPPTSAWVPALGMDDANNTTDNDSAIFYTLTPADIALLFDNTTDTLIYSMAHISCDSFQTQTNINSWQLLYTHNPGTPTQTIDLADNKAFTYTVTESCGGKPYYMTKSKLYRETPLGFTNEDETTQATQLSSGESKFYAGDTITYYQNFHLTSDWPIMEDIGYLPKDNNDYFTFRQTIAISHTKNVGDYLAEQRWPMIFVEDLSFVKITDTVAGVVIATVPLKKEHFYGNAGFNVQNLTGPKSLRDNLIPYQSYPGGIGDYFCANGFIAIDPAACPYDAARYKSLNTTMAFAMQNSAQNRVTEYYYLCFERALKEAGVFFSPGYAKYKWEVTTKWAINPDYPYVNAGDFMFRSNLNRNGNGCSSSPTGTLMRGPVRTDYGTIKTKELTLPNGGADYSAACGLTVHHKLDFNNIAGDFIPGEVRVPYKMDSIVVDLPSSNEYSTTALPTLAGSNGGAANSIQVSGTPQAGGVTGHLVFTNNQANSGTAYADFPRFSDVDGNTTVWDVSYTLANTNDNFTTETYLVPVKYYLKDEFGQSIMLVDTFMITESTPIVTVTDLGGTVLVDDGGNCSASYVDVLIANNTLYGAANVFVAAEGTANSVVIGIEDLNLADGVNPIEPSDINVYGANYYAELGGMKPAEQRFVRIWFNTFVCADSITVYTNFGCNYPATQQPEWPSSTIDTAYIKYQGTVPNFMSVPLNGNKDITNLCDIQTLEVEMRNTKNANLYNILAAFKLPPNATYVVGSAEIKYPAAGAYEAAAMVTTIGTDSLTISLSNASNIDANCGLLGIDEGSNPFTPGYDKIIFKIDVDFNACPTDIVDEVLYNVTAENFCGTESTSSGVFNFKYVGTGSGVNEYSITDNNPNPIKVCSQIGSTVSITDIIAVNNLSGPASVAGNDSLYLTIGGDATAFTLTNFTVAAPWFIAGQSVTPEGRVVLMFGIPTGIASGGSMDLQLSYDLTPLIFKVCDNAAGGCSQLGYNAKFFAPINMACAAKSLNCGTIGEAILGTANVAKNIECCPDADNDGIADIIDLDDDNDGIPDLVENNGIDPDGDDDNDGVLNYLDDVPNDPAIGDVNGLPENDADGDGIADHLDIDSDNDGITDLVEAGGVDTDGDGVIDTQADTDGDGIPDSVDVDQTGGTDANNDGIDDVAQGGTDTDGDGIQDSSDQDANGDGIDDATAATPLDVTDSDNDGIPNYLDLDSDNDGITDIVEAGGVDPDGDGMVPTNPDGTLLTDADGDGLTDDPIVDTTRDGIADQPVDTDVAGGVAITNPDTDGDGIPNVLDLDSDNDGIADIIEAGGVDTDGDGQVPTNADGTLVTDADGDGLTDDDIVDTDNDGVADQGVDTDAGGVAIPNPDTDMDGLADGLDIDADNDGITDIIEAGGVDTDNDGHVDYGTSGDPTTLVDTDGDGFADVVDTDDNTTVGTGDGGANWSTPDTDNDGLADYQDIDADNDGIVDNIEGQSTAGYVASTGIDTDGDGLDDAYDSDDAANTAGTGDGPGTSVVPVNTDLDSQPDYLDLDSDNDGEGDLVEGHDTDGDGTPEITPSGTDTDGDGLDDAFDNTVLDGTNGPAGTNGSNGGSVPGDFPDVDLPGIGDQDWRELDHDGDGINDVDDIDDDNDGIPDYVEVCGPQATGWTCTTDPALDSDGDGLADILDPTYSNLDTDGDGIPDIYDLDSDNDGIPDIIEGGGVDANGDGKVDELNNDGTLTNDADNDGWADNEGLPNPPDFDNDGQPDFQDLDSDNDGIADLVEEGGVDVNNDGYVDTFDPNTGVLTDDTDTDGVDDGWTNTTPLTDDEDTDGDGLPDRTDLDSDNDGIPDVVEDGGVDTNGDGEVDNFVDADGDGWDDNNPSDGLADFDNDGIPNHEDLDADNDGIPDVIESGSPDTNGDGYIDTFDPTTGVLSNDTDGDGWDDANPMTNGDPLDTDNDGHDNYLDLDSDNDGVTDILENGGDDLYGDGMVDDLEPNGELTNDTDGNGWDDNVWDNTSEIPYSPEDTDGDSVPNYVDLDSDNDGLSDIIESGNTDTDGDGMIDGYDVLDPDGWDTPHGQTNPIDSDDDGVIDMLDLDSDNDGVSDVEEIGGTDLDNDGMIDNFTDPDGDGWDNNEGTSDPVDTDGDGTPDNLDLDSDNDGIDDIDEGGNGDLDANNDGVIDNLTDTDGNGWVDGGTSTGNVPDTDGDGEPDYQDLDSDNDGLSDEDENDPLGEDTTGTANPIDTDGDGTPDYQDTDSDNDGVTDNLEWDLSNDGSGADDCDNDGIPNYLDLDICPVSIPEGFSPNGDGTHDEFVIDGLDYYPDYNLTILNRWGNKVYVSTPELRDAGLGNWDGRNTEGLSVGGEHLPIGTYFYIFEPNRNSVEGDDKYQVEPTKGYIYLNR